MHTYKITYNRDSLEKILNFYSHEGYVWETDPKNMLQGEQKIFLRHDIDVSLEVAREMAKTEEKYAVNSVFFIMVNSPFYNILEYNQIELLKEILDRGFRIGLHANVRKSASTQDIDRDVQIQRKVLEIASGVPISLISFHQPTTKERQHFFADKSLLNVYQLLDQGVMYLSDSNMQLNFEEIIQCGIQKRNVQLLIHPIWWYSGVKRPGEIWEKLVAKRAEEIRKIVSATERTYDWKI